MLAMPRLGADAAGEQSDWWFLFQGATVQRSAQLLAVALLARARHSSNARLSAKGPGGLSCRLLLSPQADRHRLCVFGVPQCLLLLHAHMQHVQLQLSVRREYAQKSQPYQAGAWRRQQVGQQLLVRSGEPFVHECDGCHRNSSWFVFWH